jgi:hypothetical protein
MKSSKTFQVSFFLLLFVLYNQGTAQDINDINSLPNAVNFTTGTPMISVPLGQVSDQDLSIPISLSYDASGIRIDRTSSWVGLGWNLNVGGSIIRSVRSVPDDAHPDQTDNDSYGWLFQATNYTNSISENVENFDINANEIIRSSTYFNDFSSDDGYVKDMEPDIYHFDLGGRTGSFVFDHGPDALGSSGEREIKCLGNQNLKISYVLATNHELISFTVIDELGYTYLFEDISRIYTNTYIEEFLGESIPEDWDDYYPSEYYPIPNSTKANTQNPWIGMLVSGGSRAYIPPYFYFSLETHQNYITGWYLTTVTSPKGNIISYTYDTEEVKLDESKSITRRGHGLTDPEDISEVTINSNSLTITPKTLSPRLNKIETENYRIEFITSTLDREDVNKVDDPTAPKKLNSIKIINTLGSVERVTKEIDFDSQYQSAYYTTANVFNNDVAATKRLVLFSIQESNNTISQPPYTFEYYDLDFPSRYTYETDIWGFYKPMVAPFNSTFIPKMYVYPDLNGSNRFRLYQIPNYSGTYYTLYGTDRIPNASSLDNYTNGTIKKINLPDGGNINYEYEPHEFTYENNEYTGIGIRLKKLTIDDGTATNNIVTEYTYEKGIFSSGKIMTFPIYGHFDPYYPVAQNGDDMEYYNKSLVRYSNDQADYSSGTIMYEKVTIDKSEIGKAEYNFHIPFTYEDITDVNYASFVTHTLYHRAGVDDNNTPLTDPGLELFGVNSYPFPNNVNYSYFRGQLISMVRYGLTATGTYYPVSALYHEYDKFYRNGSTPEIIYGIKGSFLSNNYNALVEPLAVYGKYPIHTEVSSALVKMTNVDYSKLNSDDSIYIVTDYLYNEYGLLYETKIDNGEKIKISRTKYVCDFDITASNPPDWSMAGAIKNMQERNILRKPIETTNWVEIGGIDYLLDGVLTTFIENDATVLDQTLPLQTYDLKVSQKLDISNYVPTSFSNDPVPVFNYDPNYEVILTNEKYNSKGNLLQTSTPNGNTSCIKYGYDSFYPIAEVANCSYEEFDFTSYESVDANTPWYKAVTGIQSICTTNVHTGSYALEILSQAPGSPYDSYASRSFLAADLELSEKYKFSAWAFSNSPDTDLKIYIQVFHSDGSSELTSSADYDPLLTQWQHLNIEIDLSDYSDIQEVKAIICHTGAQSKTAYFDDIRFHPSDARMNTKTYTPGIGITSSSGTNEYPVFYFYDDLGRLILTKDHKGNIIKQVSYHKKNQ